MNDAVKEFIAELRTFQTLNDELTQAKTSANQETIHTILAAMKKPNWQMKAILSAKGLIQDKNFQLEHHLHAELDISSLTEASLRFNEARIGELKSVPLEDELHRTLVELTTEALYPKSVGKITDSNFVSLMFEAQLKTAPSKSLQILQLQLKNESVYIDYETALYSESLREALLFPPIQDMNEHFGVPFNQFTQDTPFEKHIQWSEHDDTRNIEVDIHAFFAPIA